MLKLTPAAAKQVREAAKMGGTEGMALRLAVAKKPDGSLEYRMGFDEGKEGDVHIHAEGVEVLVAEEDRALLEGTVMDYVEWQAGAWRFIFMNPNDANYTPPPAPGGL